MQVDGRRSRQAKRKEDTRTRVRQRPPTLVLYPLDSPLALYQPFQLPASPRSGGTPHNSPPIVWSQRSLPEPCTHTSVQGPCQARNSFKPIHLRPSRETEPDAPNQMPRGAKDRSPAPDVMRQDDW
ncbi:hypothetical protein PsYK624_146110 [Phanerochaete sordida]|uniref:Uncharacterized protein n=1 Tax=Phanerochaete sordida TaxID=48140 RepID=A0A9P3LLJ6_9APHY|nr:hypothetical protein PsYK624_146110 [Phanerochaete sordida]